MKPSFFLLAGLLLSSAAVQAAPQLNLGFYDKNSPLIPAAVLDQQKFVYKIELPFFTYVQKSSYTDLLQNPNFSAVAKEDIRACAKGNLDFCVIHFGEWQGTAFLDESGEDIWTNCHVVHEMLSYIRQGEILSGTPDKEILRRLMDTNLGFTLTNSLGKKVYDTNASGSEARLVAAVFLSLRTPKEVECSMGDDAVKIKLSQRLAPHGIKRAASIRTDRMEDGTYYVGGFPRDTSTRKAMGLMDSTGKDFFYTFGAYLPKDGPEAKEYFRGNDSFSLGLAGPSTAAILSDGAEGMSGSPILNAQGEAAGIYKGFLPDPGKKEDQPFVSVFFTGLLDVEIFSEDLF